jgi:glycerol transport system ATP-binding protein
MVYQQFINYPSFSVYENIASPLRLARVRETEIRKRVDEIAETLGLTALLARRPSELSGGQQQRTALARALAKQADLVLLDEPLANLDYKLREGLREELVRLFAQRGTTVVYATTEPQEALQLGGRSIILVEGRLVQQGPTLEVFRRPTTLEAARTFSDPPLNCLAASIAGSHLTAALAGGTQLPLPPHAARSLRGGPQEIVLAVRAHHVSMTPKSSTSGAIRGRVDLAEISGSDTYLHVAHENLTIVAQIPGVHTFTLGSACTVYVDPTDLYGFNADGTLSFAPEPALGSH